MNSADVGAALQDGLLWCGEHGRPDVPREVMPVLIETGQAMFVDGPNDGKIVEFEGHLHIYVRVPQDAYWYPPGAERPEYKGPQCAIYELEWQVVNGMWQPRYVFRAMKDELGADER